MKRIILLGLLISSMATFAQDFYSSGDCKASFKFEVNPNIYTLLPATAINFYDTSEGNVKAWYWDCGDSITSTEQNPMFIFNHPIGGPTVKLSPYRTVTLTIVTDSCKSTFSQTINIMEAGGVVQQNCQALYKYYEMSRDQATGKVTFHFDNRSEGKDLSYFWQFGDGSTSNEKEPVVTFGMEQPEHKVCLTVTGADSCSSVFCDAVFMQPPVIWDSVYIDTIQPRCFTAFGYIKKDVLMNPLPSMLIEFYTKANPEPKEWYWDFGDGTTSNEPNPGHVFTQKEPFDPILSDPNPYRTVCLTVITVDGCKVSYCENINVFGNDPNPPDQSCQALFKYYESGRDTVGATAKIVFNNYSEGKDLKYFWQFGDGSTSNEKEPVHKFSLDQPEYKVCLTVIGADSCSNIFCDAVYLQYPVIIDTIQPGCFVDFAYKRKDILMSPLPSAVFDFYYKSYPEATEWYWDFGDGTTSNDPNPTHVYIKPVMNDSMKVMYNPFRTVCLTIKTAGECKVNLCQTIQVFDYNLEPEKCPVYFKYYQPDDIVSIPEVVPIKLVDASPGEAISWLWQFDDGTTSTEKEPLKTFNIFQREHKVCLTVTFADSCINTYCGPVYVNGGYVEPPVVDPVCPYYIKVDGGFPIQMSSCAGWASAKIYLGDSLVTPEFISWSTGDTISEVKGLCPTQTYSVKAQMPGGCIVRTDFILSADGSITPITPVSMVNWKLTGEKEKMYVQPDVGADMKVEWRLCDGTIVEADSIQLDAINCGGNQSNMIVKDMMGNVVYTETIALKGSVTGIEDLKAEPEIKLWPNPVTSKLSIRYSGEYLSEINIEICDIMGKMVSAENYFNISDGQEFSINTESLKQGIYICRISGDGKIIKAEKFSRR
jgi:PKD repeat protein